MQSADKTILYVDDEEHNLVSFKAAFRRDYNVLTANSAREGLRVLRENLVQLIVTDQRMPEMTGVQFLEAVQPDFPNSVRMILTGYTDIEQIIKAINTGRVYRYITKPWDEEELRLTLDGALRYFNVQEENRRLVFQLKEQNERYRRTIDLFRRYVPEQVVRETLEHRDEGDFIMGEYRIVTILFSDIRGFTRLSSGLEPEVVVKFLNEYFTLMTECVNRFKGSVNKFLGDGILALFGAPISYIENEENAVRCAIEMRNALKTYNATHAEELGAELSIGIGINRGEAIVGNIGSEDRMEYTAIGDIVNVASRIESLTKDTPNGILISEGVKEAIGDIFPTREWEPVAVKGKEEHLRVFEVL